MNTPMVILRESLCNLQKANMLWDSQLIHGNFNLDMGGSPFSLSKVVDPYWLRLMKQCRLYQETRAEFGGVLAFKHYRHKTINFCLVKRR